MEREAWPRELHPSMHPFFKNDARLDFVAFVRFF